MRSVLYTAFACAIAAALLPGSATPASPDQGRPPTELWKRFPLDPTPEPVASQPPAPVQSAPRPAPDPGDPSSSRVVAPVQTAPPPAPDSDDPSSSRVASAALLLALLGGCAVLAARAGLAVVRFRRKRRSVAVLSSADFDKLSALIASWRDGHLRLPKGIMAEQSGASDPVGTTERVDIGARVNAILSAAEDAAARHRAEALEEAAATRRDAESAAGVLLEEAGLERARLQAEAEAEAQETRKAGDAYAIQRRQEADQDAGKVLKRSPESLLEALDVERHKAPSS